MFGVVISIVACGGLSEGGRVSGWVFWDECGDRWVATVKYTCSPGYALPWDMHFRVRASQI